MRRFYFILIAALLLTFGAATARADMITQWNYELSGVFTSWTNNKGVSWDYGVGDNNTNIAASDEKTLDYQFYMGLPNPGSQTGAAKLTWGGGPIANYMELGVNSGTVQTNGIFVPGLTLHHNYMSQPPDTIVPISGTALLRLALQPIGLPAAMTFATSMDFLYFNPDGWDIFVVENPLVLSTESFRYDGYLYTFSFANSFHEINGTYAAMVREFLGWDEDKPIYGWLTNENNAAHFDTYFSITARPVPEPATMMLLGAGLAGLGMLARKRRQG